MRHSRRHIELRVGVGRLLRDAGMAADDPYLLDAIDAVVAVLRRVALADRSHIERAVEAKTWDDALVKLVETTGLGNSERHEDRERVASMATYAVLVLEALIRRYGDVPLPRRDRDGG